MTKIRYRYGVGSTHRTLTKLYHIERLGQLNTVRGYRSQFNGNEYVMVHGQNGTARFLGFCWGYGGEGPRGLITLLTRLGLSQAYAETIAFQAERNNAKSEDWRVCLLDR